MAVSHWNDTLLDRMRLIGDEPADRAVRALYAAGPGSVRWDTIHSLLDSLVANDSPQPAGLPRDLAEYLEATSRAAAALPPRVAEGEAFFATYGPEILMLLGCYSLPAAYAAAKGAEVLCRTEFLEQAARLRLFQTAQMIVDVLSPGGLGPSGAGVRAAQKVRLFHAAIRHLILADTARPWDVAVLGVPINQEDLAGTLMTFSSVVLDGLAKLDIEVPPDQQQAYFDVWRTVGRLMGIEDVLIPESVEDARALTSLIQRRQIAASPEGVRLTAALLQAMSEGPFARAVGGSAPRSAGGGDAAPGVMHRAFEQMAAVLMRHLLQGESDRDGRSVADVLELPVVPRFEAHLLDVALRLGAEVDRNATDSARRRGVLRSFNLHLIDWMLTNQLGVGRSLFNVPESLYSSWQRAPVV